MYIGKYQESDFGGFWELSTEYHYRLKYQKSME